MYFGNEVFVVNWIKVEWDIKNPIEFQKFAENTILIPNNQSHFSSQLYFNFIGRPF